MKATNEITCEKDWQDENKLMSMKGKKSIDDVNKKNTYQSILNRKAAG